MEMENGSSLIDGENDVIVAADVAYNASAINDYQPGCTDVEKVRLFHPVIISVFFRFFYLRRRRR